MPDRKKIDQFCISVKVEVFDDGNYKLTCSSRKDLTEKVRVHGIDINRAVFYNLIREGSIDWINEYLRNTKVRQLEDQAKPPMKKKLEELCRKFEQEINGEGHIGYFGMTTNAPWKIYMNIYNKYNLQKVKRYMDENNIRKDNPEIDFVIRKVSPVTAQGDRS